ncbi:T9SS C-terminal target domain-containing protein [bacterium]|nr:MAG: T9SS C-terminal target domain-containing protein [bacterium]
MEVADIVLQLIKKISTLLINYRVKELVFTMNRLMIAALLLIATILNAQDLHVRGTRTMTPRTHIDLQGNYAYTTGSNNLTIVNVSNPQNPTIAGQVAPGVGSLLSVSVAGDYAYCAGQGTGLIVIDVSDPGSPTWVANRILTYPVLHATAHDTLIAVATAGGVYLLGASNPASINILDSYGRAATRAVIDGESMRIHCGSNSGGFVLDIDGSSLEFSDQYGSGRLTLVALAPPYVNYAQDAEMFALEDATYNLAGSHNAQGLISAMTGADQHSFVGLSTGVIQYLDQRQDNPAAVDAAGVPSGITGLAVNPSTHVLVASHSTGMTVLEYDALAVSPVVDPAVPDNLALSVYPNPFNSTANLRLAIASPGEYTLTVTDLLGRIIHSEVLTLSTSAQYAVDFSGFAAGNYFIHWSNANASAVTRVVYQR